MSQIYNFLYVHYLVIFVTNDFLARKTLIDEWFHVSLNPFMQKYIKFIQPRMNSSLSTARACITAHEPLDVSLVRAQ